MNEMYPLPETLIYRPGARRLVLHRPFLRAAIAEALGMLVEIFGTSDIVLERFDDPEAEQEDPSLFLMVRTQLEAGPAREALDRFFYQWTDERGTDGFHVSVEFV